MRKTLLIFILFITDNSFGQTNCDSLFSLVDKMYQEKGAEAAITFCDKIISLNCKNLSRAYSNRGYFYNELEKYNIAIADFEKAIKIDSTNSEAYANASTSYNFLDNHFMARTQIEKAIKLSPKFYQYYRLRGDVKYSEGKYDSAIVDWKKCISLNPSYLELYIRIAKTYEEEIKEVFYIANKKANSNTNASNPNTIGQDLSKFVNDARDSAISILTSLINNSPNNKLLVFNRAEFYRRNHLYDEAIQDYLQGLKDNKLTMKC